MSLALQEGHKALPDCLPNPPVGAVLVNAGKVVACGHTQVPGGPHAEIMAINAASGDLSQAELYVTLEPCSFHGRTPSCAGAIIERGIRVVHVAMIDPDVRNAGRGLAMLRAAGVEVRLGALADEAMRQLRPYLALPANGSSAT